MAWTFEVMKTYRIDPSNSSLLRLFAGGVTKGKTTLSDGRWHHVAAVAINGKHGTSILLYVDGILENTDRGGIADLQTETEHNVSKTIRMGRHLFEDEKLMRGSIDEVFLYDSALSGDDIRQLMHPISISQ